MCVNWGRNFEMGGRRHRSRGKMKNFKNFIPFVVLGLATLDPVGRIYELIIHPGWVATLDPF